MTRKIEDAMIQAIKARRNWASGNTQVQAMCDGTVMVFLHSHQIAQIGNDTAHWTLAGWNTATTRSRINAMARAFGWRGVSCRGALPYATGSAVAPFEPIVAHQWVNALA